MDDCNHANTDNHETSPTCIDCGAARCSLVDENGDFVRYFWAQLTTAKARNAQQARR